MRLSSFLADSPTPWRIPIRVLPESRVGRIVVWSVATALLYYAAEWGAMKLTLPGTFVAVIWPANGIAIALGILVSPWIAVGVLAADMTYVATTWGTSATAAATAWGNALQVLVISILVRRYLAGADALRTPLGVVRYAIAAAFAGTLISATLGVSTLMFFGGLPRDAFLETWIVWYTSDVVGALLIAPFILVWARKRTPTSRVLEVAAFSGTLAVVAGAIALMPFGRNEFGFVILSLPLVCWAAFRLGTHFVTTATLALGVATVVPLAFAPIDSASTAALLEAQVFISVAALTGLLVAAAVERERSRMLEAAGREFQLVNAARNRLLSTFAHELNNPLTPMLLQLDLMKGQSPRRSPDKDTALAIIERNTLRLSKLVADLRDVAVLQASEGLRLRLGSTDLAAVVRDAVDAYRPSAAVAGIKLSVTVPDHATAVIDADRVSQVIANLLSNSIKYTGRGGSVSVGLKLTRTTARVSVEDTGAGMNAGQIAKLFEPFSQVQDTLRQKEGSGLGLYIARGIVESHGGQLFCVSEGEGRGSVFSIDLPLAARESAWARLDARPTPKVTAA